MSSQKLSLDLKGLYTSPSYLSGVPEGSLEVADNVVINAKNIVESRRGQTQYGAPLTVGAGQVNKLFNYASSLIVNYADKLAYDSDGEGTWVDYSGTYESVTGFKIRSLEASKNFYFTTNQGIYKLDSLTGTPRAAGVVRALGGTGQLTGASGFLVDNSAVAYYLVWGYRDANNNLLLGTPSQRLVVSNSSGTSKDVTLTYAIPDSITTEYFYQLYRTVGSVTAATEPSTEAQLVFEGNPTSGEISVKSVTILDVTPYSLMGATLYTSPSQEGIANANETPPLAADIDIFKSSAFFANLKYKQNITLTLFSVDTPSFGYLVDASADLTSGSAIVTSLTSTADIRVGMRVVGTGVPANTKVLNILGGTSITLTANATSTGTVSLEFQDRLTIGGVDYWAASADNVATSSFLVSTGGTPAQNIANTAISLLQLVNSSTANTSYYGYYLSGVEDLPGKMLFEERSVNGNAFALTSTAGDSFNPTLPTSGTTVSSIAETFQNRIAISKPNQPEAVPAYTYFNVGSANFPIQRIVALRDGIIIFKQDGIYRLSGQDFSSYTVVLLDNTVTLKVPESAVPFNNQVFCSTTQGICAVTDSGVEIMSVPIEDTMNRISSEEYPYFTSASFGLAYESDRQYMFFTVTEKTDEFATQAFVYNSLTQSWTRWLMDRTCGIVSSSVNKLFTAETDTGQILIERKTYSDRDYADKQFDVVIASVDSLTQITLVDASLVEAGYTIVQGNRRAYIEEVDDEVLTVTSTPGFIAGDADVYQPIENFIKWNPLDAENPGILKQFSECTFFFRDASFAEIDSGFGSNISSQTVTVPIQAISAASWGDFAWGEEPWGGGNGGRAVLRTYVPREKQRASWLSISLRTRQAFTSFSLQGVSVIFNPMSPRIR